jgi:hypothetical protein
MAADPRPARRIVDSAAGTAKVRRERRCRACGSRQQLSRAHIVPKGQRGDDVDANIVPLCGGGTDGCHGSLTSHHAATYPSWLEGQEWQAVASALRDNLRDDEIAYVLRKKGESWLNRVYPV